MNPEPHRTSTGTQVQTAFSRENFKLGYSSLLCLVRSSRIPATLHMGKPSLQNVGFLITLHILTAASIYLASGCCFGCLHQLMIALEKQQHLPSSHARKPTKFALRHVTIDSLCTPEDHHQLATTTTLL